MPTLPSTSSPTDTPTAIGTPQSLSKDDASATIAREQDEIADKDFGWLPIPKRLQYEPFRPLEFSLSMTASFGFGCTFVVANLFYCHPILVQMAESFHVEEADLASVATLMQAGYAVGILLIAPLGDLLRRRPMILAILFVAAALSLGLSFTYNLVVFQVLSFLMGFMNVTPQILLPLAADLAPPHRRASAISVILSGLLFGILFSRVLAGVIAEYTSWRVVYWVAAGLNFVVLFGSYFVVPDTPAKNKHLTYFQILWSMVKYAVTEPLLIQSCLINLLSSACYNYWWVTLTFLLDGEPYHYSTLAIGLFGLIGMVGVAIGPFGGKLIDNFATWYSILITTILLIIFQAVQTGAGGLHISAVILACLGLDVFRQMQQVSLSTSVFSISMEAGSRLNAIFIISLYAGQVLGTSAGTAVFADHGWRAAGALAMGWYGLALVLLFLRGPHVKGKVWFGYSGGWSLRKENNKHIKPTDADAEAKVGAPESLEHPERDLEQHPTRDDVHPELSKAAA